MPIIPAWEQRNQDEADARFIGLAAAVRVFGEHKVFDGEKMRAYVAELAQDDVENCAGDVRRAMDCGEGAPIVSAEVLKLAATGGRRDVPN